MSLIVQKYGGSSVATPAHVARVARHIAGLRERGEELVVVVSAMGDGTDGLLALAREVAPNAGAPRELDQILATGEQVSAALLALALAQIGVPAVSLTAPQAGILSDGRHGAAEIRRVRTRRIERALAAREVPIVAGFQAISPRRDVCTLGRGGSDTTAVALAVALGAARCDIFTDVAGVFTADPRVVPDAGVHARLTYQEAMLIALGGAVVLHPRAAAVAANHRMPVRILSSLEPDTGQGTLIQGESIMEEPRLLGISISESIVHMDVSLAPGSAHGATTVLRALVGAGLAVQSLSPTTLDGRGGFDVGVLCTDPRAGRAAAEQALGAGARVELREPLARVCLTGTGLTRSRVLDAAMEALARADLRVEAVESTDLGIGLHVDPAITRSVVRVLHDCLVPHLSLGQAWRGPGEGPGGYAGEMLPAHAGGDR